MLPHHVIGLTQGSRFIALVLQSAFSTVSLLVDAWIARRMSCSASVQGCASIPLPAPPPWLGQVATRGLVVRVSALAQKAEYIWFDGQEASRGGGHGIAAPGAAVQLQLAGLWPAWGGAARLVAPLATAASHMQLGGATDRLLM